MKTYTSLKYNFAADLVNYNQTADCKIKFQLGIKLQIAWIKLLLIPNMNISN